MIFVNPNAKIHFFLETSKGKTVFHISNIIFHSLILRFAFAMAPFCFRSERDSWSVVIAKDKEKHSGEAKSRILRHPRQSSYHRIWGMYSHPRA